jgi:hypothetical protein
MALSLGGLRLDRAAREERDRRRLGLPAFADPNSRGGKSPERTCI